MKKSVIFFVLVVLLSIGPRAAERKFDIIPHMGFGLSGYPGKDSYEMFGSALMLGMNLNFPIKKIWLIQTGLNFTVFAASCEEYLFGRKGELENDFVVGLLPDGNYRVYYNSKNSGRKTLS